MEPTGMYYATGEEVHAGDRVQYRGAYGTIVFVSNGDTEEIAPGYEDYTGAERGVVICDDDGAVSSLGDPDGELGFIDRG